jgi:hypothetical protein
VAPPALAFYLFCFGKARSAFPQHNRYPLAQRSLAHIQREKAMVQWDSRNL